MSTGAVWSMCAGNMYQMTRVAAQADYTAYKASVEERFFLKNLTAGQISIH